MSLPSAVVFSRYLLLHFITTLNKWFTFPWQWSPPTGDCGVVVGNTRNFLCLWWESQRSRPCHATWARVLALAWQEGRWEGRSAVQASVSSPHRQHQPGPGPHYLTGCPNPPSDITTFATPLFGSTLLDTSLFEYFLSIRLYWYLVWLRSRGFVYSGWLHRGSGAR